MINSPDFWVLLRSLLSVEDAPKDIFKVLTAILQEQETNVTADNYEAVVSLLNEFATAGSICSAWEQKQDRISKRGKAIRTSEERPYVFAGYHNNNANAFLVTLRYLTCLSRRYLFCSLLPHAFQP